MTSVGRAGTGANRIFIPGIQHFYRRDSSRRHVKVLREPRETEFYPLSDKQSLEW